MDPLTLAAIGKLASKVLKRRAGKGAAQAESAGSRAASAGNSIVHRAPSVEAPPATTQTAPIKAQGSEGAPVKPEVAERMGRFAEAMAAPAEKPGQGYTRGDLVADRFRGVAAAARRSAEAGKNIPGMNASWEQFDTLARGRGLKF